VNLNIQTWVAALETAVMTCYKLAVERVDVHG